MAQPSLWGDALQSAFANPMTLGGLSLLAGGDLNSGIQAGAALQRQGQQQRQQQAAQQGLLGLPNLSDSDRQILGNSPELANSVLENIYKSRFDPMAGLDADYKRAQIGKLKAEAADAGSAYGKTGTVVQGSDGKFYSIQFGSRGQRQILPLELGGGQATGGQPGTPPQPAVALSPLAASNSKVTLLLTRRRARRSGTLLATSRVGKPRRWSGGKPAKVK